MLLTIRHDTLYHYTEELTYTIQQLRLTPRPEEHQRTLNWHITSSGVRNPFTDAFGNLSHMLTITGRHNEVRIVAEGSPKDVLSHPEVVSSYVGGKIAARSQ